MAKDPGGHVKLTYRWPKRSGTGYVSENYQRRLMRKGVTQSQYRNKNFRLSEARGHSETPEHPREAVRHPEKYPKYRVAIRAIVKDDIGRDEHAEIVNISGLSKSQRVTIAQHWNAVLDYLGKKHPKGYIPSPYYKRSLKAFEGKKFVDADTGREYELETREGPIDLLGIRVDLAFEDFYPKVK